MRDKNIYMIVNPNPLLPNHMTLESVDVLQTLQENNHTMSIIDVYSTIDFIHLKDIYFLLR